MSHSASAKRVVITGLGVMSPLGRTLDAFWQGLTGTTSDSDATSNGQVSDFTGAIDDFDEIPAEVKKPFRKALKTMDRQTALGCAAAHAAFSDSRLSSGQYDPHRFGVVVGADSIPISPEDFVAPVQACTVQACSDQASEGTERPGFDFARWGAEGMSKVAPLWLLKCLPNMTACHFAILHNLCGPNNTITQRDVSALLAIAEAQHAIEDGDADAMIVAATGTTLHPMSHIHARALDDSPTSDDCDEPICIPFDRRRTGPRPAEGAAGFVLEDFESAIARGATIYGEIAAAATACYPSRYGTPDCQAAMASAIRIALDRGRLAPRNVGHIHAHGHSTRRSDVAEARAIRQVFGAKTADLPVTAAKGHLGSAGAGSGALELVASLLAFKHGRVFPIHRYQQPDDDCPISPVAERDEASAGPSFLKLSMVQQGLASCLAIKAVA